MEQYTARGFSIAEAELIEDSRSKILDQNICPFQKLPKNAPSVIRFEVQSETLFIPVNRKKISADPAYKRWAPLPAVITQWRRFHLYYFRSHVRHQHRADRPG
jgi:hypothetical protein